MGLFDGYFDPQQFGGGGGLLGRLLALQRQQGRYQAGAGSDQTSSAPQTPALAPTRWPNLPVHRQAPSDPQTAALNLQYQALRPAPGDHNAVIASASPEAEKTAMALALASLQTSSSVGSGPENPPSNTCPPVPVHPASGSVDDNVKEAQQHTNPVWFYNQVRNHGPWDYKQQGQQYGDFGNFNYGATGAALGFPDAVLFRMAGWAQQRAGTARSEFGNPWGSAPYGDDPADQTQIQKGIDYFRRCGHGD